MTNYEIRTTDLEEFVMCPYYHIYKKNVELTEEKKIIKEKALSLWTKWHRSLQSYLSGPFDATNNVWTRNEKSLELLEPELKWEERRLINSWVRLADEHELPNFLVTESEYKTIFQVWEDTVTVTWHIDGIVDADYIVDIKTAKQKRQEKSLKYKLQWRMYPVLYALARYDKEVLNDINLKFDYWIFTKQKKPQFQWLRLTLNVWEHYWEIYKIIKDYVMSRNTNSYQCNPGSSACFWCPLKKTWECPVYSYNKENDATQNEIISWL